MQTKKNNFLKLNNLVNEMGQKNSRIQRTTLNKMKPTPNQNLLACHLNNSIALALQYQMMTTAALRTFPPVRPIQPVWNYTPCIYYSSFNPQQQFQQQLQQQMQQQTQQTQSQQPQSPSGNKPVQQVCGFVPRLGFAF